MSAPDDNTGPHARTGDPDKNGLHIRTRDPDAPNSNDSPADFYPSSPSNQGNKSSTTESNPVFTPIETSIIGRTSFSNNNRNNSGSNGSISPTTNGFQLRRTPSRLERVIKTLSNRHERTLTHIKNFIRLIVNVKGKDKIIVTVDKRNNIESLLCQIEAEHAFDYPDDGVLECGFLYDSDHNLLQFDAVIGDVLDMYSRVIVTNIREDPNVLNSRKYKNYQHVDEKETTRNKKSAEDAAREMLSQHGPLNVRNPAVPSTQEERFQAILHNKKALDLFKDFCIEKRLVEYLLFWMEVENLQTIDPSQRLLTMKFIFLTFVSDNAPLRINLLTELKSNIEFPSASTSISVFDDAQEYVYAVLKSNVFVYFEKSQRFKVIQDLRRNHMDEYKLETIENFTKSFKPAYESLFVILGREDPNPYMEASVRTEEQHQAYLQNACSRYFRSSSLTEYWSEPSSYYSPAQRVKNILKEKKLSKFFGQRLKTEDLKHQLSSISDDSEQFAADTSNAKSVRSKSNASAAMSHKPSYSKNRPPQHHVVVDSDDNNQSLDHGISDDDDSELDNEESESIAEDVPEDLPRYAKKKKADKLTEFFGDQIPKRHLKDQNLVRGSVSNTNSMVDSSNTESYSNDDIANSISGEQKLMLSKRTKKLNTYFGEPLDEHDIKRHVVAPVKRKIQADAAGATGPEENTAASSADISNKPVKESSASSLSSSSNSIARPPVALRRSSQKNYYSVHKGNRVSTAIESPLDEDPEITKIIRKRKAEKLHQFLGERINQKLLEVQVMATKNKLSAGTSSSAPQTASGSKRTAVSQTKPDLVRKSNKLERVFGEIPPSDLILLTRNALPLERKSIISLQILLDNNTDVTELLNFMGSQDVGETITTDSSVSNNNTDSKNVRQKRLNKLRSFFGEAINPRELIEKHILSYLEESIEEKYTGDDLARLMEDLEELRKKVRKLSTDQPEASVEEIQIIAPEKMGGDITSGKDELKVPKPTIQKSQSEPRLS